MTIDATEGGIDANSYITLADAKIYFSESLSVEAWDNATDDTKDRALATATKRIDTNTFMGTRSTDTQALKFPRDGLDSHDGIEFTDGETPQQIKDAQCEIALALLSEISLNGVENFGEISIGSISFEDNQSDIVSSSGASWIDLLSLFIIGNSGSVEVFRG